MQRDNLVSRDLLYATLGLTAVGVVTAWGLIGFPPVLGAEDAAIGFRYARNFALGDGIVFNPGGERVEGFTSLLWLFLSGAVFLATGEAGLEAVLFVVSLAMTAGIIAMVLHAAFSHVRGWEAKAVAVIWLAGQAGFFFWSGLSLMDVAPWALGLTAYLLLLSRRGLGSPVRAWATPALVVWLMLTRPESMLVVPGAAVLAAIVYGWTQPVRRLLVSVLASWAISAVALTGFRLWYFGYPLPNTYYTKVSPDIVYRLTSGLTYLWEYATAHLFAWIGAVALGAYGVVWLGGVFRRIETPTQGTAAEQSLQLATLTTGMIVLGFASVVYGGGDHYQGHRFLQAYLPMAAIPLALGTSAIQDWLGPKRPGWRRASGLVLAVLIALPLYGEWSTYVSHNIRRQAYDVGLQGRFVGQTLDDAFADGIRPELGLWMVGGAGYTYTGPVKDLLGLNWIAMGMSEGDRKGPRDHAAFNVDVFWSAPPELMIPEPEAVLNVQTRCVRSVLGGAMQGVLQSPRFIEEFEPVRIQRGDGEPMIAYARVDWLLTAPSFVQPLGWPYCNAA